MAGLIHFPAWSRLCTVFRFNIYLQSKLRITITIFVCVIHHGLMYLTNNPHPVPSPTKLGAQVMDHWVQLEPYITSLKPHITPTHIQGVGQPSADTQCVLFHYWVGRVHIRDYLSV